MNNESFIELQNKYVEHITKSIEKDMFDQIYNYITWLTISTQTAQPYKIKERGCWGINIEPDDVFRMRSKKWFNEIIKPLQEVGCMVRRITLN